MVLSYLATPVWKILHLFVIYVVLDICCKGCAMANPELVLKRKRDSNFWMHHLWGKKIKKLLLVLKLLDQQILFNFLNKCFNVSFSYLLFLTVITACGGVTNIKSMKRWIISRVKVYWYIWVKWCFLILNDIVEPYWIFSLIYCIYCTINDALLQFFFYISCQKWILS